MNKSRHARGRAKGPRKADDGLYLQRDTEDMHFELMDRVDAFTGASFLLPRHHAVD